MLEQTAQSRAKRENMTKKGGAHGTMGSWLNQTVLAKSTKMHFLSKQAQGICTAVSNTFHLTSMYFSTYFDERKAED